MLNGMTVLLAEDNPTNQLVATQMLETLGAGVVVTANGIDAIEVADSRPFDVLLVDIEMPGMNGGDVIRHVRGYPGPNNAAPVIALTAYVGPEERREMAECGADGMISKPLLSIEGFGSEILEIMRHRDRQAPAAAEAGVVPAATLPGVQEQPPFDEGALAGFVVLTGVDRVRALIAQALHDLADEAEGLAVALAQGDKAAAETATHKLCGMAGAVGAMRLDALARSLQGACPEERDEGLAQLVREVWWDTEQALSDWAGSPADDVPSKKQY